MTISGPDDALELLQRLGAPPRLLLHHELVVEVAAELLARLRSGLDLDIAGQLVLVGAALHDCGKLIHPDELDGPGTEHEQAGERLLLGEGVFPELARFCRTHGACRGEEAELEDLLVALADTLWKGKRDEELEARVIDLLSVRTGLPTWEVYSLIDPAFEDIASRGDERLLRSTARAAEQGGEGRGGRRMAARPVAVIRAVESAGDLELIRALFLEYARSLDFSLCFQGFEAELAALPGDYGPPRGRLLLAEVGGAPAGCGALRPLGGEACEMKRLYVRPAFRAAGLGRDLARALLVEARAAGYQRMRLDTVPQMAVAISLYRSLGFREIEAYRPNPVAGALFLEVELASQRADRGRRS